LAVARLTRAVTLRATLAAALRALGDLRLVAIGFLLHLRFLRLEIFAILAANTALFAIFPPCFLALAIFFLVALPKLPKVPRRFMDLTARCIQRFLVAIQASF
jgi:hypothetical protein